MDGSPLARLAVEKDILRIAEICSDGWRDTYAGLKPTAYIEKMIGEFYTPECIATEIGARNHDWGGYVVAELDGQVVVAAGGGLIESTVGELFVLYADPRHRRHGGGTAALQFVTEQQQELGATEQWVSVEPENEMGRSFYAARGFVERERRPAYRGGGESLRLSRSITGPG